MRRCSFLLIGLVLSLVTLTSSAQELNSGYYDETCNEFEEIVTQKLKHWFDRDNSVAASLIRLHFHDCAVRGCDASILLDYPGSERASEVSKSLRGFEVIDDIKAAVEKKCPQTVSCADILTAVARDATVMLKGPYWSNTYGRTDGRQSYAEEAYRVPIGNETMTQLIEFFQSKGMSVLDLVVLSGAHSVGRSTCGAIMKRLYNFKGTRKPDPTIDNQYLIYLRRKCNRKSPSTYVNLDATTPELLDNAYYKNLQRDRGLLYTDELLQYDHRTSDMVTTLAEANNVFPCMFSSSMVKLANIIEDDDEGEVRIKCSKVNGY